MVNTNNVYQKVLALANKEQRGYITPQEFNLFANQAQVEIVEQYFYDINQFGRVHGNDTDYSDMLSLLNEKLNIFKTTSLDHVPDVDGFIDLPLNYYKMGHIITNNIQADEVKRSTLLLMQKTNLLSPTVNKPVYVLENNQAQVFGHSGTCSITYIRRPDPPSWGYVVVNERAMFDPGNTFDFELHPLEEAELVYKILTLAGVTIQRQELTGVGVSMQQNKIQQEKI
tara:strand:+ start:116 stop:796 length:681 start_codon:yes stop_codon:yes gene_type:complete